jgi:hypothetical protein
LQSNIGCISTHRTIGHPTSTIHAWGIPANAHEPTSAGPPSQNPSSITLAHQSTKGYENAPHLAQSVLSVPESSAISVPACLIAASIMATMAQPSFLIHAPVRLPAQCIPSQEMILEPAQMHPDNKSHALHDHAGPKHVTGDPHRLNHHQNYEYQKNL